MIPFLPLLLQEGAETVQKVADEGADNGGGEDSGSMMDSVTQFVLDNWMAAVIGLLAFFAMTLCASWAARIVRGICGKANVEETLARFFGKMAKWAVLLIGTLIILGTFGVDTAGFSVILGAMGLAVGMALQGTLGNFASGVMLLIFRPFKVGDVISAAGTIGKVFEIELFTTVLDTPDNRRIIVPNGAIFGGTIENISHHSTRRCDVAVGTDYGADLDATRAVLDKAAAGVAERIEDPGHQIVLASLGDSCIDWKVRVWCNSADYWGCMESTTRAIKVALDEAGIGIPFPQMDVHMDKLEG
ncbi:MAG: mechanosensitive ion channel family protein [Planctomycetota bacterium]